MQLDRCSLSTPESHKRQLEGGEDEEGHGAGTNTNKKRKSNAIVALRKSKAVVTPRKRGSKNNTPKKNASANGVTGATSPTPDAARKIDLRLEAKLSAEENAKMFAGRQIHPFFSSCKVARKLQELADPEHSLCTAKRKGGSISCGPIHVFEDIKDDTLSLDWSDWTFSVKTTIADHGPESSSLSILEGSVGSLNFDKLLGAFQPSNASVSQNFPSSSDLLSMPQDNPHEISPSHSAVLAHEQTICPAKPEDVKVDLEEVNEFSGQMGIFRKSDTEPLSRFLHESMRSYYHSSKDKAEECLWTEKYKPTKASEVCGNYESVNFLHEWLRLWHERRSRSRKDSCNKGKSGMQDDNGHNDCLDSGCDAKDISLEDSLQNVLLLTGPVGSGKSAAVYACAQEQGFEVLELNASDWRNGTAVKQYFGDALGSHGLKSLTSPKKTVKSPPASALPNGKASEEMNDGVIELVSDGGTPGRLHGKNNMLTCDSFYALILVEDVDILFPEDRGCIAAIQHLAKTAKGPIILTSSSNKAGLPNNFDRAHVSFSLPLPDELLCHLYMVCVTEDVKINPLLLQRFVQSCNGDIRKTIMHLQFWLQSKNYRKDRKVQTVYGSLPFDLEAGHHILQKMIPWDFPSELSKLIESKVAKSVSIMEENSCLQGLVKNELQINENKIDLNVQYMGTDDHMEDKKVEMIKRNGSFANYNEFESPYGSISELSNCSGFPEASSWQKEQRKLALGSSYSEDKDPNNGHCPYAHIEAHKTQSHDGNCESPSKFQLNQSYTSVPLNTDFNETCKAFDISCMPQSRFVPGTAGENGLDTLYGTMSSGYLAGPAVVSLNNDTRPFTFGVCQSLAELPQNSDLLLNAEIPESTTKLAELNQSYTSMPLNTGLNETCKAFDLSCMSEWTIVPGTAVENRLDTMYGAVSSGCLAGPAVVSLNDDMRPFTFGFCQNFAELPQNSDLLVNAEIPESTPKLVELNQSYTSMPLDTGLNETCKAFDLSCMPESTFVPEAAVENGLDTLSGAVSSGCPAGSATVSLNDSLRPFTFRVCQSLAELPQNSDLWVNAEIPESSSKLATQDFRDENMETTTMHNVIDECRHDDLKLNYVESNSSMETDLVQDSWRKLLDCRMDLRQHATAEPLGAIEVVKLTSGVSNLMSEADLLFRNHQQKQCGIMEPAIFHSDEATISWYDEQMMMSTVALHGFCFYAKHISDAGSKLGCENKVDLTSEMLASTPNVMALGKLSRQDHTESMRMCSGKKLEVKCPRNDSKSENRTSLFNVIRSIVPARLLSALKGIAFNEYISSLRQISMSEGFRISKGFEKRGRRPRSAQHYLSRGTMKLSPEDISLVCEGDLYRKISSQYPANVEATVHD